MSENPLLSDDDFVKFKQGDSNVYHAVFDQYYGLIKYIVKRCGITNGDVADIVQEAFLRLHQNRQSLVHPSVIKSWLINTARNLSVDHLRKFQRITSLTEQHNRQAEEEKAEHSTRELEIALVGDLLEKFSTETGESSLLDYYKKGLTAKQIAENNDEPISSVTNRLSRHRKKFKTRIIHHIEELRATIPD